MIANFIKKEGDAMTNSSMLSAFLEGTGHIVGLFALMPKGNGKNGIAPKCRNVMYRTVLDWPPRLS